jgi:hypothetical protein
MTTGKGVTWINISDATFYCCPINVDLYPANVDGVQDVPS